MFVSAVIGTINLQSLLSVTLSQSQDGMTALLFACQEGHKDVAQALLDKGANPNLPEKV